MLLTRALGRVRISGSNHFTGVFSNSKLDTTIGVSRRRRWLSSESGKRFAAMWGSGDYGRLGLGSFESRWRPAVCSALSDHHSVRALACGGAHTLFLTGDLSFFISPSLIRFIDQNLNLSDRIILLFIGFV